MANTFDITAATPMLKQYYTKMKVETLTFESAALALMPKETTGSGSGYFGTIRSAILSSVSASDTVAFGTAGAPSVYAQWNCPWKFGYAAANVSGAAIDAAGNDAGSFVRAITSETDGAFRAIGQHLGKALWSNGGGAIGQIATTAQVAGNSVSNATISLANPNDAVNFWIGQVIRLASTDGTSGAVRTGSNIITGVDINAGTLTTTTSWATGVSAAAVGDWLFLDGDFGAKMQGIPAWIPPPDTGLSTRAGLTTSFNGVVRSVDPLRYAGVVYNGLGAPKTETLIQLMTLLGRVGAKVTHIFMNPLDYADIVKAWETKVMITTDTAFKNPQIGFAGVKYTGLAGTAGGTVTLMTDVFVPQGFVWALDMKTWLLPSQGELPKVKLVDGLNWLRAATADNYQFRTLYRAATYCSNPGGNGVAAF